VQDTKGIVRKYLLDNFVMGGDVEIGDETSFMDSHVLDSTGFIELISFIEESFGVKIADEEMLPENLDSLEAIDAFVARKRSAAAAA
jgi:acyl carrier protein